MTQIGRCAHITKQALHAYSISQDTTFSVGGDSSAVEPVDTHASFESGEPDVVARKTLMMSERTCFLHAALRSVNRTKITIRILVGRS